MFKKNLSHGTALLTCVTAALLVSGSAGAVTQTRNFAQNATGACQSALPVFDGQIRKRPLAVQNEGTASAFVTCSFNTTTGGVGGNRSSINLIMYADNNTGAAVDLACTLVDGVSGNVPAPVFIPKTTSLPANSKLNGMIWTAADDNGGLNFQYTVNVSCNLPVGVGLTLTGVNYEEDVGA